LKGLASFEYKIHPEQQGTRSDCAIDNERPVGFEHEIIEV
jgi:hypothetical protein